MINQLIHQNQKFRLLVYIGIIIVASLCFATSLNFFYVPNGIFSNGVPGLAQIIVTLLENTPFKGVISTGNLYFLLNVPIILLSYFKLGRHFTLMTLIVIAASTIVANLVPVQQVTTNPMLGAVAGGVISGIGVGLLIKVGMSSGGLDIIAIVIAKETGANVGFVSFLTNLIVIVGAGAIHNWEYALYTMISIFIAGRMIDAIHTGDQRLTAFIITQHEDAVLESIHRNVIRGVTILDGQGGFSGVKRKVMMVVLNRYELYELEYAITSVDPDAFINVVQSTAVTGSFLSREQQLAMRQSIMK